MFKVIISDECMMYNVMKCELCEVKKKFVNIRCFEF